MTLGERIKKMRKGLNLTQQKFASQIGTTQNVLANYESGRRNPSASAFNNICKTFNVSEAWLRTGAGDMFLPKPENTIDEIVREYGLDDLDRQIIKEFVELSDKDREAIRLYLQSIIKAKQENEAAKPNPVKAPQEMTDEELHVELDRQILESKKQAESESAFGSGSSETATG